MRIRTYVVLMALAILLPVVAAAGIALQKIREGEREAALRGLRETARATSLIVDREVQGSLSALKVLGNSPSLAKRDFRAFYAEAAALDQAPDAWTLLLDSNGRQILNTAVPFGTPVPPPVAAQRVAKVIATQKPLITDLIRGPATGKLLITVYMPAAVGDGKTFVVAQAFAVDHWKRTAFAAKLPADWISGVIDRSGKFIARSHKADEMLGKGARPELVSASAAAPEGLIRHSTVENIEAYDAFTHSTLTGWTIAVAAPVKSVEARADRAMQLALLGMASAVGVALLVGAAFGHRLIGAIRQAVSAAVSLGRGQRPEVRRSNLEEIEDLNRALVDAGGLLEVERQSREAAERERERLLRSETFARQAAQAQNEAKDQFLAMLGHELRNPLAAITGAVGLLEMASGNKADQARYVEIVRRQNQNLSRIVDDLLDVSRLLAGKIVLEKTPLDLAEAVSRCIESLRASGRAAPTRIALDAEPVWVEGDRVRIEQIASNLILNALKFSRAETVIQVEVRADGNRAVVSVRDRGQGLAADLLPRVFDPFFQGPAPLNQMQSGLGIGLALVKQLVALHGGNVDAASSGLGQGSTFSFWMPRIEPPVIRAASGEERETSNRRLVYVEDNEDARTTTAELLRLCGYEVFEVAEGLPAQDMVLSVRPDAVVLDIGLPDIDGYEVARRLRENPGSRHIPLIALTGYGQHRDKERATAAGFDAHLVKPVAPQDLMRTIEWMVASPTHKRV